MDELLSPLREVDEVDFARARAAALGRVLQERRRAWTAWLWAGALATAATLCLILMLRSAEEAVIPLPSPPAPLPVAQVPQPATNNFEKPRRTERQPRPAVEDQESEPVLVRLYTDDPNVVIIWLGD